MLAASVWWHNAREHCCLRQQLLDGPFHVARNGQSRSGRFHCARRRGEEQPSCWTKMRLLMGRVNGEDVVDTGPGANQWVEITARAKMLVIVAVVVVVVVVVVV